MKTIVFKKEFEDKLKKLKIKGKYINNLKNADGWVQREHSSMKKRVEEVNQIRGWFSFIDNMALWDSTPEGCYFWAEILLYDGK